MIVNNYKEMFSVDVFHSFFGEKKSGILQLKAGNITKEIMKRFEIAIRITNTGIAVYYCTKNSLNDFINYIKKSTSYNFFDFDIVSETDYFYYITDLPYNFNGQLFFNTKNASYQNVDEINLSYVVVDNSLNSKIGELQVNFSDILNTVSDSAFPRFVIRFKSRSTQWQYYIINRNNILLDNPEISGKGEIYFNGPEKTVIPNGETALLFSSGTHLIPLQESPQYKFDLINRKSSDKPGVKSSKIIFKGLPNPNPRRFGIANNSDQVQYSSPMYIYL